MHASFIQNMTSYISFCICVKKWALKLGLALAWPAFICLAKGFAYIRALMFVCLYLCLCLLPAAAAVHIDSQRVSLSDSHLTQKWTCVPTLVRAFGSLSIFSKRAINLLFQ